MGHDFSGNQSGYQGSQADTLTGAGSAEKLRMRPTPNFLFCHHPERWQVMNGEVLPALHKLSQDPGVANVSPRGGGDMSPAIGIKVKNGWTIIPHDVIEGGYVRKFEGAYGAIHLTKWETPRQHGLRAYDPKTDGAGYRAFLKDLLDRGVVQPPPSHILDVLISRAQACVDRAAPHTATKAGQAMYDRAVSEFHAVEVACGVRPAPAKTKTKAKTKRKSRAKVKPSPVAELADE